MIKSDFFPHLSIFRYIRITPPHRYPAIRCGGRSDKEMGLEQFSFLARDLPGFRHRGDKVRIIYEPKDFYKVRKTRYTLQFGTPV